MLCLFHDATDREGMRQVAVEASVVQSVEHGRSGGKDCTVIWQLHSCRVYVKQSVEDVVSVLNGTYFKEL